MKMIFDNNKIIMESENADDTVALKFLNELHQDNLLIELLVLFSELFEKEVLRVQDGKFCFNDDWTLIEDVPGYI